MSERLREIAHTRAGDKGNKSDISVFVYEDRDYSIVEEQLTEARVEDELTGIAAGPVTRYELPNLGGFKFVIENALDGGVTTSLRMDSHGKSLSSALLNIKLDRHE
jgi:hypothetical protein